jgi:Ca2+-transporting ATPase
LEDGSVVALTEPAKRKIMAAVDAMAARALRCLAFALKTDLGDFSSYDGDASHPVSSCPCLHWLVVKHDCCVS